MSGMFDNFTHVDNIMRPNEPIPKYPNICAPKPNFDIPRPNKPYENVAMDGSILGYFWHYGDSVDLIFDIDGIYTFDNGYYIGAADLIQSLLITFSIYDHRRMCILLFSNSNIGIPLTFKPSMDENGKIVGLIIVNITNELSKKLPQGVYRCSLTASHESGYHETLFNTETCTFEVR